MTTTRVPSAELPLTARDCPRSLPLRSLLAKHSDISSSAPASGALKEEEVTTSSEGNYKNIQTSIY